MGVWKCWEQLKTWAGCEEKLSFVSPAAQRPNGGVCLEDAQVQKQQAGGEAGDGVGLGVRILLFFLSSRLDVINMSSPAGVIVGKGGKFE